MARPKAIEDHVLLELIKKYFQEECNGNIKKLKYADIVRYINTHGYPDYPSTTLRRTQAAVDYIEELRKTVSDTHYITTASYQTIDAASLVDSNRSRSSLIKAITERDNYYKTVADAAAQSFERYNSLLKQYDSEKQVRIQLEQKNQEQEEVLRRQKDQIKQLTAERNAYKSVVDNYVYPEIANDLLAKEGAIRTSDSMIKQEALDDALITPSTNIRKNTKSGSKVIEGLFQTLDE